MNSSGEGKFVFMNRVGPSWTIAHFYIFFRIAIKKFNFLFRGANPVGMYSSVISEGFSFYPSCYT